LVIDKSDKMFWIVWIKFQSEQLIELVDESWFDNDDDDDKKLVNVLLDTTFTLNNEHFSWVRIKNYKSFKNMLRFFRPNRQIFNQLSTRNKILLVAVCVDEEIDVDVERVVVDVVEVDVLVVFGVQP